MVERSARDDFEEAAGHVAQLIAEMIPWILIRIRR
jgi:hypothetical protein